MKKIIATLVLASVILCSSLGTVFAEETLPTYSIKVDPYNAVSVEAAIDMYALMPQTAEEIRAFATKCASGEIEDGAVTVETHYNPRLRAVREYTGYGGYKYREETVKYSGADGPKTVYSSSGKSFKSYLSSTVKASLSVILQASIDAMTTNFPIASLLSAWMPSSYQTRTEVQHRAELYFNRTVKHVYQNDNGQYYYPAVAETVTYWFENEISIPGVGSEDAGTSKRITETTDHYGSGLDQKAYQWKQTGYSERFDSITFKNAVFNF